MKIIRNNQWKDLRWYMKNNGFTIHQVDLINIGCLIDNPRFSKPIYYLVITLLGFKLMIGIGGK